MATFSYTGLNPDGKELRGRIDAAGLAQAREALRGQGIRILDLGEGDGGGASPADHLRSVWRLLRLGLSVRNSDMQLYYRQMQLMLRAGHTLLEALEAASRLSARPRLSAVLDRCAGRVRQGSSFSAALAHEASVFPRIAVKLCEAGEASGELDQVFERMAAITERRADVRRQLLTAMTYPAIVTLAAIGVISFLVGSVVPRFAVFLQSRGKAIPWAAKTMMDIADWLGKWGFTLVLGAAALVAAFVLLRRVPGPRLAIDRLLLHVPVLGGAMMSAAMAQMAWTFGLLLKSRLTALDALRTVCQVTGNRALANAFAQAGAQVLEGRALAVALARPPVPRLMQHMVAVGERSGEMEAVMEALGSHYQKELDGRVKLLSSMIEPVLTLLIGGIVGFVYYAFFQAVLAVSTGGG
ncbi:MAG: type II secretion system F family protein [Sulfuricella sp.]|nr:type II secretion system F family protein [Sulfuricella sp.]